MPSADEAPRIPRSRRRAALVAIGAILVLLLGLFGPPFAARRVGDRLKSEAARRGVALTFSRARFAWPGAFVLEDLAARKGELRLEARSLGVVLAFGGRDPLGWVSALDVSGGRVLHARGFSVDLADGRTELPVLTREFAVLTREGAGSLHLRAVPGGAELSLKSLDAPRWGTVKKAGRPFLVPGRLHGVLRATRVVPGGDVYEMRVHVHAKGLRLPSLGEEAGLGAPVNLEVSAEALVDLPLRRLVVRCWQAEGQGLEARGTALLFVTEGDAIVDLDLHVPEVRLKELLSASGAPPPDALAGSSDLGSLKLDYRLSGHLKDPQSLLVEDDLRFRSPEELPPALLALRGPFVHRVTYPDCVVDIDLRDGAPGFVPLVRVPPLFVRALTISEDAGFFSHEGLDLRELPVALATNWIRGESARGGSTISQQLAKNLFLSREKTVARKVREAALTLLLESALTKERILEIYLNVIEWGPKVHGLGPACRFYFGKPPEALTPKEMAFLVSLIPGPVKYQSSIAGGTLRPGFARLVVNVLAKLRSVDALTEEEYLAARDEELGLFGRVPAPKPAPVEAVEPVESPTPSPESEPSRSRP
ncbi:MAG: transglycosylase domain-containing protein [Acidobacteria bacterium]|nr:transglycosylase domain-containing protein [Acidobacteriota bacterium]